MISFPIPDIMQCIHFQSKNPSKQSRIVKDYEVDLYLSGKRDVYIDDIYYKISRGSLIFRKPGQTIVGYGDYDAYMLTLDFSHKNSIPPESFIRGNSTPLQDICELDVLDSIPTAFFPYHLEDMISLYKKLLDCSYPNLVDTDLQKKYITEFLFLLLSDAIRYNREYKDNYIQKEKYIDKAIKYINLNFRHKILIDDIARHLALNKNYMIRMFKKELSTTPNKYIMETRLFNARLMLIQTKLSIQNISLSCGFNTPAYFVKCFKAYYNVTPVEYRKNYEISDIHN